MLRVSVIGFGYWGPNLVRNFSKCGGCRLVAVADLDASRREKVRHLYPTIDVLETADELLERDDIDAVAIATPISTHYRLAEQALASGKHVLVEKPMTASSQEARHLIRLAEEKERVLMVDHTFIYTGAIRKLRQIIQSKQLGEIYYYDSVRINLGLFQQDLNVLWDLAPHDFSIMDYLIDKEPVSVSAVGASPFRKDGYSLQSIAYVTVGFEDETLAHFHVNWMSPVKLRRTLIGGSRKMAIYDPLEPDQQVKVVDKGVEVIEDEARYRTLIQYRTGDLLAPKIDQTEALQNVCRHFLSCIESGESPLTDGYSGLRVVQLLEAAQKSIERQQGRLAVEIGRHFSRPSAGAPSDRSSRIVAGMVP